MYSINSCNDSLRVLKLFRDTILKKVTTRGRDHTCSLPSALLRHHSRDTIDELQRPELCNEPKRSTEQQGNDSMTSECVLFSCLSKRALSGPFTVLFSIVTGLEVSHQLVERKLLIPKGLVWSEQHLVRPCPRSQNPSHRAVFQTGLRPTNPSNPSARTLVAEP